MTTAHALAFDFVRPRSRRERIARLDALASLLDSAVIIPGLNVGDVITATLSLFIVVEAHRLGAPFHVITRMLVNIALDGVVGSVPLVGDAFDVLWRSNRRNMRLLQKWLEREGRR
jgi:Domain of unknown function (DUF4112)